LPSENYGFLILLISAEALWGAIISYPQTKDVLLNQAEDMRSFSNTVLFSLLLGPLIILSGYLYFRSFDTAIVIFLSAVFFSLSNVTQYVLRVCDIALYNRVKLVAAVVSTVVFFILLPIDANFLPLVYGSSMAVALVGIFLFRVQLLSRWVDLQDLRRVASGWAVFGTQSAMTAFSQYGVRFAIGASLSLVEVAIYTKTYMLASGVTFLFSAVMVVHEKNLAKALPERDLRIRYPEAGQTLKHLLLCLTVYFSIIVMTWWMSARFDAVMNIFAQFDLHVFFVFSLYFSLQAIYLTMNPMAISIGGRAISLAASFSSLAVQVLFVALFWHVLNLRVISQFVLLGQAVLAVILFLWLLRVHVKLARPVAL
jgi:hypothetical protein